MTLDKSLIKEFVQITDDSGTKTENTYLRGTIVANSGGKYVQLDGSTTATPISEIVDVEEGDRVLVSIENHKATIIGNFTFPPSARKEQEALDKADEATTLAGEATNIANEAKDKAETAMTESSIASASANEAKTQAGEAITAANNASTNADEAKTLANEANTIASEAKTQAAASQAASADAQAEVTKLQNEVKSAQEDVDSALSELETQAGEITSIKETYATKVEVGDTKAELETTISKSVGELETTVSETYSTKTENVELEGRLQSQITQNADGLASQVTKTEKIEADTAKAQEDVAEALAQAAAAQTSANNAQTTADAAQAAADAASADAATAADKATTAQNAADAAQAAADAADQAVQAAQSDLNEAKQNLENVTSRVDATEADIADAQAKVDAAQTSVNEALADAAEANLAATNAQEAADQAKQDAATAQSAADTAQQKADNAQTAADNAQAAADQAQADVAALTSRVTKTETDIVQTNEEVSLQASKIEEVGDNLNNNYYNKTETDAKIKVESDRISSTVSRVEIVEKEIDETTVGGRNLIILNGITTAIFTGYRLAEDEYGSWSKYESAESTVFEMEPDPQRKDGYITFTTYDGYFIDDDDTYFQLVFTIEYDDGEIYDIITQVPLSVPAYTIEQKTSWTFEIPDNTLWISVAFPTDLKEKVKLEYGNKSTDWSPAPEDVDQSIDNVNDDLSERLDGIDSSITAAYSNIDQLADMISHLVVDGDGQSMMTQTSTGWTFDMSTINENLNAVKDAISDVEGNQNGTNDEIDKIKNILDSVVEKTAYFTISKDENDDPFIELGRYDNEFKIRITNTTINFMEGATRIAYASNNTFYSGKIITNNLQIGEGSGFVWKRRPNGNLGLSYITG